MNDQKDVFGIVEHISIPQIGYTDVPAKIDTGAYSGALHCSHVEEAVRESDSKNVLRFSLPGNPEIIELSHYVRTYIRSSTGHRIRRYLFDTDIVIKGIAYRIRIGLSDRSDMNYEVLIGRRFLSENNIMVDVRINQNLDIDREKKL